MAKSVSKYQFIQGLQFELMKEANKVPELALSDLGEAALLTLPSKNENKPLVSVNYVTRLHSCECYEIDIFI